ncbi:MAG: DUF4282 domain-containing protein [Parvularcula sp.]|nr:DUF4282 domain-containing protein [Parvularcula sp.]
MSELVGRFLSFEEDLGRDLVKFVYYVLLFLLVVTTLYELVVALIDMFTVKFWPNFGRFLVAIPLRFFISLLLLRVGTELVIAILSIDDRLREREPRGDVMSSGLNPVRDPLAEDTLRRAKPTASDDAYATEPSSAESDEPAPAKTAKIIEPQPKADANGTDKAE